jgi:hypothetical protein
MKATSPFAKPILLSLLTVAACAAQHADDGDQATGDDALIGHYDTPDPGNVWTKNVDLSQLALGEETRLDGEADMFSGFSADINDMQNRLATVNGAPLRGFHAKAHACVEGQLHLEVPASLAASGANVGLFAENGDYPTWVRYSNGTGFVQSDKSGDVRGLAIKIMKVSGKKLMPGQEDAKTVDFLMTNGPTTPAPDSRQFVGFGKALTDARVTSDGQSVGMIEGMLKTGGWLLRPENSRIRAYLALKALPSVLTHGSMLGEQFWTGGAFALGVAEGDPMTAPARGAAKMTAITGVLQNGQCTPVSKIPDIFDGSYLRSDLKKRMAAYDTCIDLQIQIQNDPAKQPIEDTSVEWDARQAPFTSIGYVAIPRQDVDAAPAAEDFCNSLTYSPWHARVENRPLGNIMRARLPVYEASRKLRGGIGEPTGDEQP